MASDNILASGDADALREEIKILRLELSECQRELTESLILRKNSAERELMYNRMVSNLQLERDELISQIRELKSRRNIKVKI